MSTGAPYFPPLARFYVGKNPQAVIFQMTRADMRSVMTLKDLYLALADVHTELDNAPADLDAARVANSHLKRKLELVELHIEAVTNFAEEQHLNLRGHVADLERTFLDLIELQANKQDAMDIPGGSRGYWGAFDDQSSHRPVSRSLPANLQSQRDSPLLSRGTSCVRLLRGAGNIHGLLVLGYGSFR
jgi:hypothetical protein